MTKDDFMATFNEAVAGEFTMIHVTKDTDIPETDKQDIVSMFLAGPLEVEGWDFGLDTAKKSFDLIMENPGL